MPQAIDFFSVTLLNLNDNSIQYKTLLFATKNDFSDYLPFESHLSFDSTDRLIRGTTRTDIKEAGLTSYSYSCDHGQGKSNLIKVMLWDVLDKDFCGILVLDAHDEYFGTAAP